MFQPKIANEQQILEKINDKHYKVISFGVADFLVLYPFWRYDDIFWLLQKDFQAVYCRNETQFYPLRISAKEYMKKKSRTASVNMKQIYNYISETENITPKESGTLMRQECRLSEMYCYSRNFGHRIFNAALKSGKPVIIAADAETSRGTIAKVLTACGYSGYEKMYISSNMKTTKEFGGLYRRILSERKLKPDQLLHIGSHIVKDSMVPQNIGIENLWVPSPKLQMTLTPLYSYVTQMLSIDGVPWISDSVFSLRSILAQTADSLFDVPSENPKNNIFDAASLGTLLSCADKEDEIVKAVMKDKNARVCMRNTEGLIEHFGMKSDVGMNLPLEYVKKYSSKETRHILKGYMGTYDYVKWRDGTEPQGIEPKKLIVPEQSGIFKQGTKLRALIRFVTGL